MARRLSSFVVAAYLFAVFALPVIAIPIVGMHPSLQKGMVVAFLLGVGGCVIGVAVILFRGSTFTVPTLALLMAPGTLLAVALVSSAFAPMTRIALWGTGFELSTLGSVLVFAATAVAASLVSPRFIRGFLYTFVISVAVAGVISWLLHIWSPRLLGGETVAGEWSDLSFLIAAALLVCAIMYDRAKGTRLVSATCGLALAACFVAFFHPTAALLLAVGSIAVMCYFLVYRVKEQRTPVALGFVAITVFAVFTLGIHTPLLNLVPDVRPSLLATELVLEPLYLESLPKALFGEGANMLPVVWERYRVVQFNASPLWDQQVDTAYSAAGTFATTFGMLGLFAFLLCPLFLAVSMRTLRAADPLGLETTTRVALLALACFLFIALIIHPAGTALLLVAGASLGAYAALPRSSGPRTISLSILQRVCVGIFLVGAGCFLVLISGSQFLAALDHARGMALRAKNPEEAAALLQSAVRTWGVSFYERDASHALLELADAEAGKNAPDTEILRQTIRQAADLADHAVLSGPSDYSAWLYRAAFYAAIMGTGYADAENTAERSFLQAKRLAPTRPEIPYAEAQFELARVNAAAARLDLQEALKLKSDYEPARALLGRL